MAQSLPKPALRPMLVGDVPLLAAIFRAAIEELAQEDYGDEQVLAWAAQAEDEAAFGKGLAGDLTLVATMAGGPVGFASLKGKDVLSMLYVHPSLARHGIGMMLCDALERLAAARGATKITTDASDTAMPLFEKRGYLQQRRNSVVLGDVWLGNTTMTRTLAPAETRT